MSFSPDGKKIASGSSDQTIRIWDGADGNVGEVIAICKGHSLDVSCVAWSVDSLRFASSGTFDKTIRLWDATTYLFVASLVVADGVHCVSFSPDGSRLAACSEDSSVYILDAKSGLLLSTLRDQLSASQIKCVAWSLSWSSDSSMVAVGALSKTVKIWDTTPLTASAGTSVSTAHSDAVVTIAIR